MQRFALVAVALVALAAPANAQAALLFVFDQPSASPNERVTLRTGGTPQGFKLSQRVKPLQRSVRLYLVRNNLALDVHSRLDPRLQFVGSLAPDRNWRGLVRFSAPPLDAGAYTIAYWCPGCAANSRGRTFLVQQPAQFRQPYRAHTLLHIETTKSCPVTLPNGNRPSGQRRVPWYGNGLLWAGVTADGTYAVSEDRLGADGSIGNKLLWVTTPPTARPTISGERLDAPAPPLEVLGVNQGSFSGAANPSYMSAVNFPTAGCWRLRARVGDLSLSYGRRRSGAPDTRAAATSSTPSRIHHRIRARAEQTLRRPWPRCSMSPRASTSERRSQQTGRSCSAPADCRSERSAPVRA